MSSCPGPLVWYDVVGGDPELPDVDDAAMDDVTDALLACLSCDFITMTGNFNDDAHHVVDLIHEGL